MNVCHVGNSDDLVPIPAMTGTVAVNFEFILMDYTENYSMVSIKFYHLVSTLIHCSKFSTNLWKAMEKLFTADLQHKTTSFFQAQRKEKCKKILRPHF